MKLLLKELLFGISVCAVIYFWLDGSTTYIYISLVFCSLSAIWLMFHKRNNKKSIVKSEKQQNGTEPTSIAEHDKINDDVAVSQNYSQTMSKTVTFDKYEIQREITSLYLGIFFGMFVAAGGYFSNEPEIGCFLCFGIFVLLALSLRDFKKKTE